MKLITVSILATFLASTLASEPLCISQGSGYCQAVFRCHKKASDSIFLDCIFGIYDSSCRLIGHTDAPTYNEGLGAAGIPYKVIVKSHLPSSDPNKIRMQMEYAGIGFGKTPVRSTCNLGAGCAFVRNGFKCIV
ncbi:uncharacterized protein BDZ99DRAFT_538816 [Mytilinidion resinicola]|uniref:Uncharacterized protein n=1 Tax=Mytilinidion resinicola TaxID=574789 RepID=A0A6A6YCI1_9PEZI|nr:uncharacterized protein BDZ99DRAFT_538816 [Mytilinidion resinicola]KAF2806522.1 hypothetical protein BDZ99DRAFT_538816 [Mytilinidion resinicola]